MATIDDFEAEIDAVEQAKALLDYYPESDFADALQQNDATNAANLKRFRMAEALRAGGRRVSARRSAPVLGLSWSQVSPYLSAALSAGGEMTKPKSGPQNATEMAEAQERIKRQGEQAQRDERTKKKVLIIGGIVGGLALVGIVAFALRSPGGHR